MEHSGTDVVETRGTPEQIAAAEQAWREAQSVYGKKHDKTYKLQFEWMRLKRRKGQPPRGRRRGRDELLTAQERKINRALERSHDKLNELGKSVRREVFAQYEALARRGVALMARVMLDEERKEDCSECGRKPYDFRKVQWLVNRTQEILLTLNGQDKRPDPPKKQGRRTVHVAEWPGEGIKT